jgi:hypothetical protein
MALVQVPFVWVCMNASVPPAAFLNFPTATQFPDDVHEIESSESLGLEFWTPASKVAGLALDQVPLV